MWTYVGQFRQLVVPACFFTNNLAIGVQEESLWQLLVDDALNAMKYCLKHRPYYHKAQYRLAMALWHLQSPHAAVSEMRQLFSRGRKQFTISLWKIIDDEVHEREVWPTLNCSLNSLCENGWTASRTAQPGHKPYCCDTICLQKPLVVQ